MKRTDKPVLCLSMLTSFLYRQRWNGGGGFHLPSEQYINLGKLYGDSNFLENISISFSLLYHLIWKCESGIILIDLVFQV